MNNLHITYIQSNLFWQDKQANLEHFDKLLKEVPAGTDLVLLPETFNTAFPVDPKEFAETEEGYFAEIPKTNVFTQECSFILEEGGAAVWQAGEKEGETVLLRTDGERIRLCIGE